MFRLATHIYRASSAAYSKFVVSRSPVDKFVTFYPNDSTVGNVISSLSHNQPPEHKIYAASGLDPRLIDQPIP